MHSIPLLLRNSTNRCFNLTGVAEMLGYKIISGAGEGVVYISVL
ncbi:hypothetical protein GACE_1059 [Geoglobus acetivorans]|uniref:Uncharacterized protein n=1 Tax=Geoglobus acetivorans TaxID=565033 RepID=A0A0A7GE15_GEOAI|nr:hypothetical protein GACE_1059 [Geoglobus acetivorans]